MKLQLILLDDLFYRGTGPQGEAGAAGADAETPTISIGTVTTGDPGTQAAASITGTAPNYILNLTIPQGPTGQNA